MARTWAIACTACGWDWRFDGSDKRVGNDAYRDQDRKHRAHHSKVLGAAKKEPQP